jgi:hypothetical protein
MAEVADQAAASTSSEADLVAAVRQVLERSDEPLTLSKIRAALPAARRGVSLEQLEETLQRQVAANVLYQYPKYRSSQNRYWDRPMPVHLTYLLRTTLEEKPLPLSELRRKLPDYAKNQVETVLAAEVERGTLFLHPALSSRSGQRYSAQRPEPRDYLRTELAGVFRKLEQLGFRQADLREAAMGLLQEEEWAATPLGGPSASAEQGQAELRSDLPRSQEDQERSATGETSAREEAQAHPAYGEGNLP